MLCLSAGSVSYMSGRSKKDLYTELHRRKGGRV